ncbi:peptidylprolyl isomerase [Acidisphaera sp. S103]|uniref:peptidylprolyl isomerase n=1 Tax=Acidisphaera sp. S103 TaxID=1747223 RepID=UPI00131BBD92|nr:peptidylprolyl isomerase [Acidisphaera sp. S103]
MVAAPAIAQTAVPGVGGLQPPDIKSDLALDAALAVLDRSANTVVAEVGPHTITWGDVADAIRALPPIVGNVPFPVVYQRTAMQLVEQEALVLRGERAGLEKDPAVRRRMQNAADQAMATEVLRRSLAPNLTDKALLGTYNALVANKPAPEEVEARLIMVDSEEQANTLIQRLQGGADFGALARDFSKDGTAANGGELGYVRLDMLAPEIGSVMFALAPGQTTAYPIRSHNAWFIVRVEGRRQPSAPTFAAARDALQQDIIHAGAPELMREAVKDAPVKYYGLTGKKAADKMP